MADVKRLHYFNHQFLVEADFTDEQQYHLTMRRRHNEALHTYGVAEGLTVQKTGDKEITVQPGVAIDRGGRELVLLDPRVVSVSGSSGSTVTITLAYHEEESDASTATGVTGNTRIKETPEVQAVTTATPGDGSIIRLAQFVLDSAANVPGNNGDAFTDGRQAAGAVLIDGAVLTSKLADGAVTNAKITNNTIDENKFTATTRGKLVTNGNSHDHAGGDGAQIRHSALNLDGGTNPHGTTAADVGALPATGGIVSGSLQVNGSIGVGVAPQAGDKLFAIARDGSAGTVVVEAGAASSNGSGTVSGLAVNAYGSGTGWKQGITSSVSGAGLKQAGQFSAYSAADSDDSTNALYAYASSEGTGIVTSLQINSSGSGTGWKQGIICNVSGAGPKRAGQFFASSAADSDDYTSALFAYASNDGTGPLIALQVNASGSGTGWKQGITCFADGAGPKRAGQFFASSAADSNDYTNTLYASASSDGTGNVTGLQINSSGSGTGSKEGIICSAGGAGPKQAGQFIASSAAGSTDNTTALSASASSAGTGSVFGLDVNVSGSGTGGKRGINCSLSGAGPKYAGQFSALGETGSSDFTSALWGSAGSEGTGDAYALIGIASGSGTGTKYGVYGYASGGGTKYAGYFIGNVYVGGTLSKASGTFLIDHPLDPENKTLRHSFVESPENLCLYRGKAKLDSKGQTTVKMPDYFAALTKEDEATISLTAIGSKPFLTGYEWNQSFTAFTLYGEAGREVSYLVLANRDDPVIHQLRRPVEEKKGKGYFEKGQLLNPEAFGKAPETAFAFRDMGPVGAPPEGAEAPMAPAAFASMDDERQRMEETLAKAHEEQQQRMTALRQEEEQRRQQLEETLAALPPQQDQPPE